MAEGGNMKRIVILNPGSKAGRAARVFREMRPDLENRLGRLEVYETRGPMDAADRVRAVLKGKEFQQIIIAGGDGTINEGVNGYFENGKVLSQKIPLGVMNLGTGGDFHKTVRQISPLYDVALKENKFRLVDCGLVHYDGKSRAFMNIASAGVAGQIMHSLKSSSFQWGSPAYFYHTLKSLALFAPKKTKVRYREPGGSFAEFETVLLNFFACNGRFNGGGMNWAPGAGIEDGLFDVVVLGDVSKAQLVIQSPKVYAGRISEFPGTRQFRTTQITLQCQGLVQGEADGEVYESQKGELRYEILPHSIPLVL
jgi:diacylglycerol kinase family enzyme